ncbi:MAG: methylmalonyl Co-A mutase-associated GTPase MeaB [Flavobacteriales bacterium]
MKTKKSALHIQKGKAKQNAVSNLAKQQAKTFRKQVRDVDYYFDGIRQQNRQILSQAITLVESRNESHKAKAQELIKRCLPFTKEAIRIGITGVPGVGKSTFIESFGLYLCREQNKKVAVLAVDPSSETNKGSILGDKTRMEELSIEPKAFIRPSPTSSSLGGVSRRTRESIVLCEAAGFDVIIIETVGVGQSETAVHSMVDFFLLLALAGAGDELQGIKRGIMEMADAVALTKADGANAVFCKQAQSQFRQALHLLPAKASDWIPPVFLTSAIETKGIEEVYKSICSFENQTKINGFFEQHRAEQHLFWFRESLNFKLNDLLYKTPNLKSKIKQFENQILEQNLSPFQASEELIKLFLKSLSD